MLKKYSFKEVEAVFHGQEPWVNVFILKYITLPMAYISINYLKLSPNFITALSLFFAVSSGFYFSQGDMCVGAALYLFSYLLDAIDGKVARVTSRSSVYGAWFDIAVDRLTVFIVSVSISVAVFEQYENVNVWVLNSAFLFLFLFGFESRYNTQLHQLKLDISNGVAKSNFRVGVAGYAELNDSSGVRARYRNWCVKKGVINQPFSLVEVLMLQFVFAPVFGVYSEVLIFSILLLIFRVLLQQKYWIDKALKG